MDISVVIPCLNGATTLPTQLESLEKQVTIADFEVIVSDNGSSDDSAAVASSWKSDTFRVRVVDSADLAGINHSRNVGIQSSTAALILFCDVDDVVEAGWIEAFWSAYQAGAKLLGGSVSRVFADGTAALSLETGLNNDLRFLAWPTGANCGVAREVTDACGLFDESFLGGGDEAEFFWRAQLAGYEMTFVPLARIAYVQRAAPRSLFRQQHNYGRSHAKLYSMFGAAGMPRFSRFSSVRGVVSGTARIAMGAVAGKKRGSDLRQHGIRQLGQMTGRISGSWQYRVWYF